MFPKFCKVSMSLVGELGVGSWGLEVGGWKLVVGSGDRVSYLQRPLKGTR
jgi:hypothetical protein